MIFSYILFGCMSARERGIPRKNRARPVRDAVRRAGLLVDEELREHPSQRRLPLTQRKKGFALDQRLTAGDTVVLSLAEFLSADEVIDTLNEWTLRGVRLVLVEAPAISPEQLREFMPHLAGVLHGWRRDRRAVEFKDGNG